MADDVSRAELEAAHCWEAGDRVPGRPAMTDFRRALRLHQARWREANGYPTGTHPLRPQPGKPVRLVGSRLPLGDARETGANFVTKNALAAVQARLAAKEPQQSWDQQGLWADLLSSSALAFNLFGDLAADLERADRAVHTWWPDTPGTVCDVRFEHSPGRLDLAYTGSLVAFSVAFVLDLGDGTRGIIGVEVRLHERMNAETPKPERAVHYATVAKKSRVFRPNAISALTRRSDLLVTWLTHLLVLSMLQQRDGEYAWGRFALVYPAGNTDYAGAAERYRAGLADPSSFAPVTIEELLKTSVLPKRSTTALRKRYIIG